MFLPQPSSHISGLYLGDNFFPLIPKELLVKHLEDLREMLVLFITKFLLSKSRVVDPNKPCE